MYKIPNCTYSGKNPPIWLPGGLPFLSVYTWQFHVVPLSLPVSVLLPNNHLRHHKSMISKLSIALAQPSITTLGFVFDFPVAELGDSADGGPSTVQS